MEKVSEKDGIRQVRWHFVVLVFFLVLYGIPFLHLSHAYTWAFELICNVRDNIYASYMMLRILSFYCSDPIAILKRLVGELFETDIELKNRLSKVEGRLGIVSSESPAGNASKVDIGEKESKPRSATGMNVLKSLGGRLVMGGGFLWGNEDETTLDSIVETGTQLGTSMTLQARGQFRNGKDFVLADVEVDGAENERFCLRKVVYSCGLSSSLRLMFAPFGARGNDVTYTLNPFSGRGLIAANSEGNPLLYNRGTGSALAATLSLPRAWLTASFFGSENEETAEKVMVQTVFAPLKAMSLGFTVSDPTASNGKLKEYTDSLMRFVSKAPQARTQDTISGNAASDLEIAGSFALSLGKYACHGWATTTTPGNLFSNDVAWNVVLGDKGTEPGQELRWILSAGKTFKSETKPNSKINDLKPDTFEISTDIDLGNGLHCQPGVLAIKQQSSWVFLAGAKTIWDF